MKRFGLICLLLFSTLPASFDANAAGGADVVDDSEPETPGVCHLETWVSLFLTGGGYVNEGPACTTKKMPWVQLGATAQQYWGPSLNAPLFGPALKINLQHADTGVGVGLGLNSSVNLQTGDLASASTIVLVTLPINERVNFNFNMGWSYVNGDTPNSLFYGGQFEADVGGDVSLMMEVFGRTADLPGTQFGLRYTPGGGRVDFDLLVANYFGIVDTQIVTLGVTVRY